MGSFMCQKNRVKDFKTLGVHFSCTEAQSLNTDQTVRLYIKMCVVFHLEIRRLKIDVPSVWQLQLVEDPNNKSGELEANSFLTNLSGTIL